MVRAGKAGGGGVGVDWLSGYGGGSAVHAAGYGGDMGVIAVVVAAGGDCLMRNIDGRTPAEVAVREGWVEATANLRAEERRQREVRERKWMMDDPFGEKWVGTCCYRLQRERCRVLYEFDGDKGFKDEGRAPRGGRRIRFADHDGMDLGR